MCHPRAPRLRTEGVARGPVRPGVGKGGCPRLARVANRGGGRGGQGRGRGRAQAGAHTEGARAGGRTQQEGEGVYKPCLHTPSPSVHPPVRVQTRTQRGRALTAGGRGGREEGFPSHASPSIHVDALFILIYVVVIFKYFIKFYFYLKKRNTILKKRGRKVKKKWSFNLGAREAGRTVRPMRKGKDWG